MAERGDSNPRYGFPYAGLANIYFEAKCAKWFHIVPSELNSFHVRRYRKSIERNFGDLIMFCLEFVDNLSDRINYK